MVRQVFFKSQIKGIFNLLLATRFAPHAFSLAYCEMWWQVQKRLRSPPRRCTDRWTGRAQNVKHNVPLNLFLKVFHVTFTHKQRSPQRSVTTRGSAVGDSSTQELFMDSSALWYGWGSPAPIAYTHLPNTLRQSHNFQPLMTGAQRGYGENRERLPGGDPVA